MTSAERKKIELHELIQTNLLAIRSRWVRCCCGVSVEGGAALQTDHVLRTNGGKIRDDPGLCVSVISEGSGDRLSFATIDLSNMATVEVHKHVLDPHALGHNRRKRWLMAARRELRLLGEAFDE